MHSSHGRRDGSHGATLIMKVLPQVTIGLILPALPKKFSGHVAPDSMNAANVAMFKYFGANKQVYVETKGHTWKESRHGDEWWNAVLAKHSHEAVHRAQSSRNKHLQNSSPVMCLSQAKYTNQELFHTRAFTAPGAMIKKR